MTEDVVMIRHANGAWLVQFMGEVAGDQPESDNFDAASSLVVAKRIGKEGARSMGYRKLRWSRPDWGGWTLSGELVEDD